MFRNSKKNAGRREGTADKQTSILKKLILFIKRIPAWLRDTHNKLSEKPLLQAAIISVLLVFTIEALSRHSLISALGFLVLSPHVFLYNAIIVSVTVTPVYLFRRRDFFLTLICSLWLGLGIANSIVLSNRITPLGMVDILLLSSVSDIIEIYLNIWYIILICLGLLALIALMVFIWIKCIKRKVHYFRAVAAIVIMCLVTYGATWASVATNSVATNLPNLAAAYKKYGFAYCFSASVIDRGISKPDSYSHETVGAIMNKLPEKTAPDNFPNIIFLQLESFFDIKYIQDIEISADPTPVFRALKQNYPSGFLTVPSISAGTANTEFECITGMSIHDFGTGEYPYKTVLQDTTCESVCTYLSEYGITCHAIHNNVGNFYDRNTVFSNLGFDTFISLDYMDNVIRNPIGWAKDSMLTNEILLCLDSTDNSDFVYTISVQPHGKYPSTPVSENLIKVNQYINQDELDGFEYYINQLYEVDCFIADLIAELSARDEDTVLVMYGDHLPGFTFEENNLSNGNLFQTEYVIWSNFELNAKHQRTDLRSYQLYSYVLDLLGASGGIISRIHQTGLSPEDLVMIEYDMLYGENYALGLPYPPTELQMGIKKITVTAAYTEDKMLYVTGENFTEKSCILLNGKRTDTVFIDKNTLYTDSLPQPGDFISVGQLGSKKEILSRTDSIEYQ